MTDKKPSKFHHEEMVLVLSPWEKGFNHVRTPFEEFVHRETTSGLLLMGTAILALVLANSTLATVFSDFSHTPIGFSVGGWELEKSLKHWVNDGLMTLFFFVVGLELKRSILVGELSDPRQAVLPILAAVGGMVVPALLYYLVNSEGDMARGWGIPMATDIAFALGAIALLAGRVPKSLITFLVALAIVDDLGAVLVIAVFYTESIVWEMIFAAGGFVGLLVVMNKVGIRSPNVYFLVGIALWLALLKSGVHATLAGVITAFTIPAKSKYDPAVFSQCLRDLLDRFDDKSMPWKKVKPGQSILSNESQAVFVQAMKNGMSGVETPLQRLEHSMHMPVAFFVLPLFALLNAGLTIEMDDLATALMHPVTLGVGLGLILGKFIGIAGVSWVAIRLGVASLPKGANMMQICGVALLGGIGFTMSIFIAELAFSHQPELILQAKLGILFASLFAGIAGYLWLWLGDKPATDPVK